MGHLVYHRVVEGCAEAGSVPLARFHQHCRFLRASRRYVSVHDDVTIQTHKSWVTLDDGDASAFGAVKMLTEVGIKPLLFVIPGWLNGRDIEHVYGRALTWAELRELMRCGAAIGSHSYTHRRMDVMSWQEAVKEAEQSKVQLEDLLGIGVSAFAFPYGFWSATAVDAVRTAGYGAVFGTDADLNAGSRAGCAVAGRATVGRSTTLAKLVGKVWLL